MRPEGPKDKHLTEDEIMVQYYPMTRPGIDLRLQAPRDIGPAFFTSKFRYDNTMCYHELKKIVEGTEAEVYVDEFTLTTDFCSAWQRVYNTFLGEGSKHILAGELEAKIANSRYTGPRKGFTFTSYVERHKTAYQGMLALEKKTDYRAYDPGTRVRKFLAGIQDPALSQAKLSIQANSEKYGSDFDACVDYLTNCVGMQQSNQRIAVAATGSSTADNAKTLKTHDAQGCELVMPAIFYNKPQWDQLSKAQQESVRERRNAKNTNSSNTRPGRGGGSGGRNRKRQRGNRQSTIDALATNVTKLTDAVGIMAAQIRGGSPVGSDGDNNVEGDSKMSANANNPALTKNRKKG